MKENQKPLSAFDEDHGGKTNGLAIRIGNTTYVLNLHFSQTSKLTLEDKIKQLIRKDMERLSL